MVKSKQTITLKRKIESGIILTFCMAVIVITTYVLLLVYKPNHNALGALASVCMDVISMAVLIILALSMTFERGKIATTTKLFLGLMLGTIYGLFFDFLTWSSDGNLDFADWTYVFTVASLCMGSVLAGIFVLYLGSYFNDMYGMKGALLRAKVCAMVNAFALILTFILALTHQAFDFVDGHYKPGELYDYVTAIPILTLFYMAYYVIRNVKTIGIHDVLAVVGYVLTMIIGALVESAYSIGTTFVGVTIADVIIFMLLQNKLLFQIRKQKELLDEKLTSQYEILESMAGIYTDVNYVDFEDMTARRFNHKDSSSEKIDFETHCHTSLNTKLYGNIEDDLKEKFWEYTNLSTLRERMNNEKIISAEFCHKTDGWFRAQYIRIGENTEGPVNKVIYAIRNIDEEKKNVEKWIRKSNTDELTGLYNRHAYEDDITALEEAGIKDDFVYVSIDVNSLKIVNDSLGHEAGDELILGACECMKQCFGSYGKLYRTGGDEFAALIYAGDAELKEIIKDVEEVTENWKGTYNEGLAISCGYVTRKEAKDMPLRQIAIMADKRMYDDKTRYYQRKGIDRRGQRDAHVALCALYTKILKINISDDSYQIVNMNNEEKTEEKGFADRISIWLFEFGKSGQVHPDDLEEYLAKTDIAYIRDYFKKGNDNLCIFYRRKYPDGYRRVMMEIIPANDYSSDSQNLFLYVKDIERL